MTPLLPIDEVLDDLGQALAGNGAAVLQAPPGAGKTTRVPLALLDAAWLDGKRIVMLEPRRVAARAAAARLAGQLGGKVGGVVGHRMRNDTLVSGATRIEVVTEGVLTRMLQRDPSLEGIGAVIFDEFHERSLHADLGLALVIEARAALRPDLRLLVMSATLDGQRVAELLGDAPIITSEGRQHPITTHHRPPLGGARTEEHMAAVISEICGDTTDDILAFLPGAAWIRRTEGLLRSSLPKDTVVAPLYGMLSAADQDRAIRRDGQGRRKIVLATDIAETSLTIDGVGVVVDGGQRRAPRFDPRSGLSRLVTTRISLASADQRRGRAGRQGPGICYRLWSEADHANLEPFDPPEIIAADLAALALQLAQWGARSDELMWLDSPPGPALAEAVELLEHLGALDTHGRMTEHGDAMVEIGADPRMAHMMVAAADLGLASLACDVAGLLSGRDPLERTSVDMRERVAALRRRGGSGVRGAAMQEARTSADRWRRQLGVGTKPADPDATGVVIALAFPDRIGQQRGASGSYRMASGRGGVLPDHDPLTGADFLAVADVDGDPRGGRIYLAAPLDRTDLDLALGSLIARRPVVEWDSSQGDVVAEHRTGFGALVFKREPIANPPTNELAAAWAQAVASEGLGLLAFDERINVWRNRLALLRSVFGDEWPDLSDEMLLATTDEWLAPHLARVRRRRDLAKVDLWQILRTRLDWQAGRRLDELAPTHFTVPSGNSVPIGYADPEAPTLSVRLQEMFGLVETPTIAQGRVGLVIHLLSPAQRPVQITRDLASFWSETYPQVKAELMGRYPKHHWPTDPITATPTARIKRRS